MKKKKIIITILIIVALLLIIAIATYSSYGYVPKWYCDLQGGRISSESGIVKYNSLDDGIKIPVHGSVCKETEKNIGQMNEDPFSTCCCIPR